VRRTVIPELLDSDSGTPEEIAASIGDLRLINRLFGGVATTQEMLARVLGLRAKQDAGQTACREISLLDVAAASGDVTLAASRRLERRGIRITRALLDRSAAHLPRNGSGPGVVGDALRLPFADASFDLVSSSLFVHHLEAEQIAAFMAEALRVCRTAVLINDLRRSATALALTYAGLALFRSRLTRHDAIASVRRAYTISELESILRRVPAHRIEARAHYLFRMGVIVWK
jgi:ubiquinone/menaquinone biosynthesis C-methylase UbiE